MDTQITILDEARHITGITLKGRLDAIHRNTVKAEIHKVLATDAVVIVLDMQHVPFIDSSGLSALVSGLRTAREQNKDIILTQLNKQAQMVFNLTMMDRVFAVYPTIQSALESLSHS